MSGIRRLHIGGLWKGITENDVRGQFGKYGDIKSVDIISRDDSKTFAYINVDITDNNLQKCFNCYSKATWKGEVIQVQIARESYFDKLAKEREALKKENTSYKNETTKNHDIGKSTQNNYLIKKSNNFSEDNENYKSNKRERKIVNDRTERLPKKIYFSDEGEEYKVPIDIKSKTYEENSSGVQFQRGTKVDDKTNRHSKMVQFSEESENCDHDKTSIVIKNKRIVANDEFKFVPTKYQNEKEKSVADFDTIKFTCTKAVRYDPNRPDHKIYEISKSKSSDLIEASKSEENIAKHNLMKESNVKKNTSGSFWFIADNLKDSFKNKTNVSFTQMFQNSSQNVQKSPKRGIECRSNLEDEQIFNASFDTIENSKNTKPHEYIEKNNFKYSKRVEFRVDRNNPFQDFTDNGEKESPFFFVSDDFRIKSGLDHFRRSDDLKTIEKTWNQQRLSLVAEYQTKKKRFVRHKNLKSGKFASKRKRKI